MILSTGSYGSLPQHVFDKCIEISKRSEGRPDSFHRREYQAELLDCRVKVAKLMNCDVDECAITNNTTHGVHTILNNFHWKKDDILVGCKPMASKQNVSDKYLYSQYHLWSGLQHPRIYH